MRVLGGVERTSRRPNEGTTVKEDPNQGQLQPGRLRLLLSGSPLRARVKRYVAPVPASLLESGSTASPLTSPFATSTCSSCGTDKRTSAEFESEEAQEFLACVERAACHGRCLHCRSVRADRGVIGGIVHDPHGEWIANVLRGMLDAVEGFLVDARYLILDRDPVFRKGTSELSFGHRYTW